MYNIVHLPTNTVYALKNDNRLHVVFFRKFDNARYVGESITAHYDRYKQLPEMSEMLCLQRPNDTRQRTSMDARRIDDMWVQRCDITHSTALRLATHGLGMTVVDALNWTDNDWCPTIRHVNLKTDAAAFLYTLTQDNDMLLE